MNCMCGCSCPRSYRRNQVGDIFFQHSNPNCPGNPKIHGLFGVAWTEGNDSKLSCDLQYTSDDQEINTNFEKISKCVKNDKPKCSNCQCSECVCDKSQCVCDTSQCVCETSPCLCNKRRCTCSYCVPLEPVDSLQLTPKRREKRPEYVPKRPSQQNLEAETKPEQDEPEPSLNESIGSKSRLHAIRCCVEDDVSPQTADKEIEVAFFFNCANPFKAPKENEKMSKPEKTVSFPKHYLVSYEATKIPGSESGTTVICRKTHVLAKNPSNIPVSLSHSSPENSLKTNDQASLKLCEENPEDTTMQSSSKFLLMPKRFLTTPNETIKNVTKKPFYVQNDQNRERDVSSNRERASCSSRERSPKRMKENEIERHKLNKEQNEIKKKIQEEQDVIVTKIRNEQQNIGKKIQSEKENLLEKIRQEQEDARKKINLTKEEMRKRINQKRDAILEKMNINGRLKNKNKNRLSSENKEMAPCCCKTSPFKSLFLSPSPTGIQPNQSCPRHHELHTYTMPNYTSPSDYIPSFDNSFELSSNNGNRDSYFEYALNDSSHDNNLNVSSSLNAKFESPSSDFSFRDPSNDSSLENPSNASGSSGYPSYVFDDAAKSSYSRYSPSNKYSSGFSENEFQALGFVGNNFAPGCKNLVNHQNNLRLQNCTNALTPGSSSLSPNPFSSLNQGYQANTQKRPQQNESKLMALCCCQGGNLFKPLPRTPPCCSSSSSMYASTGLACSALQCYIQKGVCCCALFKRTCSGMQGSSKIIAGFGFLLFTALFYYMFSQALSPPRPCGYRFY